MVVYRCVQQGCPASFSSRDLLHVHVQNHKQGKEYCFSCDKFYVGRKHLNTAQHKENVTIAEDLNSKYSYL